MDIKEQLIKVIKFILEPILEEGRPSFGRVLGVLTFLACCAFWGRGLITGVSIEVPDTLWNTLAMFTGYVMSGKGLESISNIASMLKGKKQDE